MTSDDLHVVALRAWGERGFQYARARGWDIAQAEDIRQAFIVELLEHAGQPLNVPIAFWKALRQQAPVWWDMRRDPFPSQYTYLPPTDQQLDASAYLAMLSKADAHFLRRWLAGEDVSPDVRKNDLPRRRRDERRRRLLGRLRTVAEADLSHASPENAARKRARENKHAHLSSAPGRGRNAR